MLPDIGLGNDFLNLTPNTEETKAKINKWSYIELKSFCTVKETNAMRRQSTEWEKIFANHIPDKKIISKIYKELIQLSSKKNKRSDWKIGKRFKQTFFQRRHTDGQWVHETMLNIINQREMQIKTMRYHFTPVRIAIIKNKK